jgi:DNA uptake protein ComE-like DNA-binding protein
VFPIESCGIQKEELVRELLKKATIAAAGALVLAALAAPPAGAAPRAAQGAAPSGIAAKVDLNTASEKQLEGLPGVGTATARKIIAGRPYASVSDLSRAGVSAKVIAQITPLVWASGGAGAGAAETSAAAPSGSAAGSSGSGVKASAAAGGSSTSSPPPLRGAAGPGTASRRKADLTESAPAPKVDVNTASEKDLRTLPGVGVATARRIINNRPYSSIEDLARAGVPATTIAKLAPMATASSVPPRATGNAGGAGSAPAPSSTAAPAPSPAPAPAPAPAAPPSASGAAPATTGGTGAGAGAAAAQPPVKGMVWVNLDSKIYHYEGDRFYGKTKHGQFMTEADAIKAGYRASKSGPKPK